MKFRPQTLTTPDLGSVAYCCVDYSLDPPHSFLLLSDVSPPKTLDSVLLPHGIIRSHGNHPSPSHHTKKNLSRLTLTRHFKRTTPPLLPCPHHACQIPVTSAPTLPPKSLLTFISDIFPQSPVATTSLETSPLHCIPSHLRIPLR